MSLVTWKKFQRKLSCSKVLNKTLALRRQIRKTSRRKFRYYGNGCHYTNMTHIATDMNMTSSRHHIATGGPKTAKPKAACKTSVNNKIRQTVVSICANNIRRNKCKEISSSDSNVNKCPTNNCERNKNNILTYLSVSTQINRKPTKSVSLGPTNCSNANENGRIVQLNIIRNRECIWRHHHYSSNALGKIRKTLAGKNPKSTEIPAAARNKPTAGIERSAQNIESISRVSVPIEQNAITIATFSSKTTESHCSSTPSSCYSTLWPFSTSSTCWSRKRRHRVNSTSSWNTSPLLHNGMVRGILMTMLVLIGICHNGVPVTSAASIILPDKLSPTSPLLTTPRSMTLAVATTHNPSMLPIDVQHKELPSNPTEQQNSLKPSSLPQEILYHRLIMDDKHDETARDTSSQPQADRQSMLLPAKEKRAPQLPQYPTSTPKTSSRPNRLAHDIVYRKALESLSIAEGGLMLPIDLLRQAQRDREQQQRADYGISENSISDGDLTSQQKRHTMPVFDFGLPQNITARTGHVEAAIKCRVDRIGDKSVSWIRKRDLHILSVGKTTYTSDKRYVVSESKDAREWTLHIRTPQARDSGIYECQVNTEPKMSMAFQLNIIEISPNANAIITGPTDLYVKVGSVITLTCLVRQPSIKDIGPIHWYRSEHLLTPFAANDAKIQENYFVTAAALTSKSNSVDHPHSDTDMYDSNADDDENVSQNIKDDITQDFQQRVAMEQQLCDTIKSRLRISNAQKSDSGNYTCQPTTASSASVVVHVINEENPAAMQKSGAASRSHL